MFECLRTSFKLSFRYHIGIKPASSINKTMQIKTSSKLTNSIFWKSGGFRNELLIVTDLRQSFLQSQILSENFAIKLIV